MTDPTVIDLLSDVDAYLCALHVHVARHDQIGADLTCGGCKLRDRVAAALPQLAAVPPANQTTDRADLRDRIADVVIPLLLDTLPKVIARSRGYEVADAVLAVLPPPADRAAALTEAERTMLTYALDLTQEQMLCVGDEFSDADHAAVDSLRRLAAEAQPTTRPDDETLAAMFEGLGFLLATSSRDWGQYAPDAWLYAVVLGWDCEETEHDETCTHGAMEEMQQRHGWSDEAVAKARRYRAAVRALTEPAAGVRQDGAQP